MVLRICTQNILFKFNPEIVRLDVHQNIHAYVNILNNISLEPIHLIQNSKGNFRTPPIENVEVPLSL